MFAIELTPDTINAVQAVALAIVAGFVALRMRRIDTEQKRARRQAREEKARCDGLEARVKELEGLLQRVAKARRRK